MSENQQQIRPQTTDEQLKKLFSRTAKLNDAVEALLAPEWGSEAGIIPAGHPLYVGEKPAAEQERAQPSGQRPTTTAAERIRVLTQIVDRIKNPTTEDSATEDAPAALVLTALEDLLAEQPEQSARTTADNPPTSSDTPDNSLQDQLQAAIESEVYEFRERTMWWPEGEITKEIARLATRGAMEIRDRELEQLQAKVAEFDHIINWHTTCASCARILDSSYQETMRAEKAETALREVLGAFEVYWARANYCGPSKSAVQPEHFKAWRSVLQSADHDTGPSVAECRQDDRVWPLQRDGE